MARASLYLIMPPQHGLLAGFANGLLCLRKYLELSAPDQEVEIVDMGAETFEMVRDRLEALDLHSDVAFFGITTTTATHQAALHVAREIKAMMGARGVVILGGHHASADAETILSLHSALIDFIIRGEGEIALDHFLRVWPNVASTPNLVWRRSDGAIHANADAPLLTSDALDALAIDQSWFLEHSYPGKFDHYTFITARGCPLQCKFCAVANQTIRGKSPEIIAREVRQIVAQGFNRIAMEDNFFAHSTKRTKAVCASLRQLRAEGVDFTWDCQTRVEAVARPGVVAELATAGCEAVYLGVEALTPGALKFLGKTANPQRYVEMLRDRVVPELMDHDLEVYLNLQFGLPEFLNIDAADCHEIVRMLGRAAYERGKALTLFPQLFVVYPGTAHFKDFVERGLLWPNAIDDFTAWERTQSALIGWIGRHFAHGVGGLPLGVLRQDKLARQIFEIDPESMFRVTNLLADLEAMPGIKLFKYANYLAPLASTAPREASSAVLQLPAPDRERDRDVTLHLKRMH